MLGERSLIGDVWQDKRKQQKQMVPFKRGKKLLDRQHSPVLKRLPVSSTFVGGTQQSPRGTARALTLQWTSKVVVTIKGKTWRSGKGRAVELEDKSSEEGWFGAG